MTSGMMWPGVIGGRVGHSLLRWLAGSPPRRDRCSGDAYRDRSKLEVLLGPGIWRELEGKVVLDFGCGTGADAIEVASRGAKKVIGLDIRERALQIARRSAADAGLADRCVFVTETLEGADAVISLDGFEHYADPRGALSTMKGLLRPGGRIFIAFGPPWFHPLGGHLFSVFPWAHLIFTEKALIRWRSDFKTDGATRFGEVEGGLNRMTVRRFRSLVDECGCAVEEFVATPIRRLAFLSSGLTREFVTSIVRCRLARPELGPGARW
jgi:SAM-dependent methyltransferase